MHLELCSTQFLFSVKTASSFFHKPNRTIPKGISMWNFEMMSFVLYIASREPSLALSCCDCELDENTVRNKYLFFHYFDFNLILNGKKSTRLYNNSWSVLDVQALWGDFYQIYQSDISSCCTPNSFVMVNYKTFHLKHYIVFVKICPPTGQITFWISPL